MRTPVGKRPAGNVHTSPAYNGNCGRLGGSRRSASGASVRSNVQTVRGAFFTSPRMTI